MLLQAAKQPVQSVCFFKSAPPLCQTFISAGVKLALFNRSRSVVLASAFVTYEESVKVQLSDYPSMMKDMQAWLESEYDLSLPISAIDKFLRQKLGYRYKKTWSPVSGNVRMSQQPGSTAG